MPGGLGWALSAYAAGQSVDIGLVPTGFACGDLPAFEAVSVPPAGTRCLGGDVDYARAPLVLYENGTHLGDVIAERTTIPVTAAWVAADGLALQVGVGVASQVAPLPDWGVPGGGLTDLSLGVRRRLGRAGPVLRVDLTLPIGVRDAYLGEGTTRLAVGLAGARAFGKVTLLADGAGTIPLGTAETADAPRALLPTGPRLNASLGALVDLGAVDPYLAVVSRLTLARAGERANAESLPVEVLVGGVYRSERISVGGGVGRGVVVGAGSSRWRLVLSWHVRFGPVLRVARPEEDVVEDDEDALPNDAQGSGAERVLTVERSGPDAPLAVVAPGQTPTALRPELPGVELRFALGSAEPLPGTEAEVARLAAFLVAHREDGPVLLEGYASREGGAPYNFGLAMDRATAIFVRLVEAGVDPRQVVVRGLGELPPRDGTRGDDARRVEARWADRALPVPGTTLPAPWGPDAEGEAP